MRIYKIDNGYTVRYYEETKKNDFDDRTYHTYAFATLDEVIEFIKNNAQHIETD